MNTYSARLERRIRQTRTPALVGIDPRFDKLPGPVQERARQRGGSEEDVVATATLEFCLRLLDVVADRVPAVKPQVAFFELLGPPGMHVLSQVMKSARDKGLLVLADAKRGDIGSTARAYARAWLAGEDPDAAAWPADALTINPFLGSDTLEPFRDIALERGAGIYVLVRTSNPGAPEYQECVEPSQPDDDAARTVSERVADLVEAWSAGSLDGNYGQVGAVVGARSEVLPMLRQRMPHTPLLIPGYGKQGGNARDVAGAFDGDGLGALINSASDINFAYDRAPYSEQFGPEKWEDAIAAATDDMIADLAAHTPAAKLSE